MRESSMRENSADILFPNLQLKHRSKHGKGLRPVKLGLKSKPLESKSTVSSPSHTHYT